MFQSISQLINDIKHSDNIESCKDERQPKGVDMSGAMLFRCRLSLLIIFAVSNKYVCSLERCISSVHLSTDNASSLSGGRCARYDSSEP